MWRIFAVLLNEERKKLIENSPGLPGKTLDLNSVFVVQIQIDFVQKCESKFHLNMFHSIFALINQLNLFSMSTLLFQI